jgi:hypothetical protein
MAMVADTTTTKNTIDTKTNSADTVPKSGTKGKGRNFTLRGGHRFHLA